MQAAIFLLYCWYVSIYYLSDLRLYLCEVFAPQHACCVDLEAMFRRVGIDYLDEFKQLVLTVLPIAWSWLDCLSRVAGCLQQGNGCMRGKQAL